jgi:arylsulfatase A-like enzyme
LIVVASDHGEQFGERNLVLHGNSIYQSLLHVPLVIKFPGSKRTGIVNDPVSLIDVAPTILAALGYPIPDNVQGRDLLAPGPMSPRQLFGESYPCPALHRSDCPREGCLSRSVFSWPFKYTSSSNGRREFFDVANDPKEDRNLLTKDSRAAKELNLQLGSWIKSMPAQARQRENVGGEALQQLKSLGYVQ